MAWLVATLSVALAIVILTAVRVNRIAPWRSLLMVAVSTGSLKACVEFLRYCERL